MLAWQVDRASVGGKQTEVQMANAFASADLGFVWNLKGQRSLVLYSRQATTHAAKSN